MASLRNFAPRRQPRTLPELLNLVVSSEQEFIKQMTHAAAIIGDIYANNKASTEEQSILEAYAAEFKALAGNPIQAYEDWQAAQQVNHPAAFNAYAIKMIALLNDQNSPLHKRIESYARWIKLVYFNPAAGLIWRANLAPADKQFLNDCMHLPQQRLYELDSYIKQAGELLPGLVGANANPAVGDQPIKTTKWPWYVSSFASLAAVAALPVAVFAFSVVLATPLGWALLGLAVLGAMAGIASAYKLNQRYAADRLFQEMHEAEKERAEAVVQVNNDGLVAMIQNSLLHTKQKIDRVVNDVLNTKANEMKQDEPENNTQPSALVNPQVPMAPPMIPAAPSAASSSAASNSGASSSAASNAQRQARHNGRLVPAQPDMMTILRQRLAERELKLQGIQPSAKIYTPVSHNHDSGDEFEDDAQSLSLTGASRSFAAPKPPASATASSAAAYPAHDNHDSDSDDEAQYRPLTGASRSFAAPKPPASATASSAAAYPAHDDNDSDDEAQYRPLLATKPPAAQAYSAAAMPFSRNLSAHGVFASQSSRNGQLASMAPQPAPMAPQPSLRSAGAAYPSVQSAEAPELSGVQALSKNFGGK
jgi:hypothetical protein